MTPWNQYVRMIIIYTIKLQNFSSEWEKPVSEQIEYLDLRKEKEIIQNFFMRTYYYISIYLYNYCLYTKIYKIINILYVCAYSIYSVKNKTKITLRTKIDNLFIKQPTDTEKFNSYLK